MYYIVNYNELCVCQSFINKESTATNLWTPEPSTDFDA